MQGGTEMQFTIVTVGKCRTAYVRDGVEIYLKRLRHYCKVDVKTVKEASLQKNTSLSNALGQEADRICKMLPAKTTLFALDRSGDPMDSLSLADEVGRRRMAGGSFTWIVGSAFGLHRRILALSDRIISLSQLTFPHELSLLILTEQLYRINTILKGEQYHK